LTRTADREKNRESIIDRAVKNRKSVVVGGTVAGDEAGDEAEDEAEGEVLAAGPAA
jgi:hypothetical protein